MNRKALFDRLRAKPFGGFLSQPQVDGTNTILDVWERNYRQRTSIAQLAYCFGTTFHETGRTMQPIKEYGDSAYFTRMYDKTGARPQVAATLGNTEAGDGAKFCGRGDVQLTGRDNYRRATKRLRELGIIGLDIDFERDPDLVMRPDLACHIMFIGMEEGWFTGAKLDTIIDDTVDGDEHADYVAARKIINGTDRAANIAGYSDDFLAALVAADSVAPSPTQEISPIPPPVQHGTPAAQPGDIVPTLIRILTVLQSLMSRQGDFSAMLTQLAAKIAEPPPSKLERPGVALGTAGFFGGLLAQLTGTVGPPQGLDAVINLATSPTVAGTLTTLLPIAVAALSATGAGGSVAAGALKIFGPMIMDRMTAAKKKQGQ